MVRSESSSAAFALYFGSLLHMSLRSGQGRQDYLWVGRVGDGVSRGRVSSITVVVQHVGQTRALPGSEGGEGLAVLQRRWGVCLTPCRCVSARASPSAGITHAPHLQIKRGGTKG